MPKPDLRIVAAARVHHAGNLVAAEKMYWAILAAEPNHPDANFLLGMLKHQSGGDEQAVVHLRRAIALQPRNADFHKTLLETLLALKRVEEATGEARVLVDLEPGSAAYKFQLARLLSNRGRVAESVALREAGLKLQPNNDVELNELGTGYIFLSKPEQALRCFQTAVRLNPREAGPLGNIGAALMDMGRYDEAIAAFEETRRLHPRYTNAANNLGNCYSVIGENAKAIASYRRAIADGANHPGIHSNLLMCLLYSPDLDEQTIFKEHLEWGRVYGNPLDPPGEFQNDFTLSRKLRVGYVSPDFREHSVRYFIEPILASHNRDQFEIFCYATGMRADEVTTRLRGLVSQWHDVADASDVQLADLIRSHRIDILVDLAGHTSDNHLPTFARRPAPVQVTYLGYPATTGLSAMDYRLTDSITDPTPDSQSVCCERLIRLPDAFFVYTEDEKTPFDPLLPADKTGFFTFGSFNNMAKINDRALAAWARILNAVPNSRFLMKSKVLGNPSTRQKIFDFFQSQNITLDRLALLPWVPLNQHMQIMGSVDVTLDTFPYNGHTTSCQSLWMGVPFITRMGNSFRSRVGASILRHLDLPDLIAESEEAYVTCAVRLAGDLPRLRELRRSLRQRMRASPLMNAKGFTENLENVYHQMWRNR